MVVHHEQVAERAEGPSNTRVRAERIRAVVILEKARELQIRRHVEPNARSNDILNEMALPEMPDVPFGVQLDDEEGRWLPRAGQLVLSEVSIVERTEPPCCLRIEPALGCQAA